MKSTIKDEITNKVIKDLEELEATGSDLAPWVRGWRNDGTNSSLCLSPRNGATQRPYSGINWVILSMFNPFKSNEWFTENQASDLLDVDSPIPDGEDPTRIVFYKNLSRLDDKGEPIYTPYLKAYQVWNREQVPGLPEVEYTSKFDPKSSIDEMLVNLKLKGGVHVGGDRACYVPSEDAVCVPNDDAFDSPDEATSVKAHEGCHATGADHRLKRKLSTKDATAYAYEELIAELGSAMVCASLGIPLDKLRHTEYIGVWLKRLKNDKTYIFRAAADANKAMQYLITSTTKKKRRKAA